MGNFIIFVSKNNSEDIFYTRVCMGCTAEKFTINNVNLKYTYDLNNKLDLLADNNLRLISIWSIL